ncbi:MAG: penicillin acylase family protein [Deltaproteobacteria bacterium]|nr:penicillin acylase family protein [Deltaproteobacteria bacterium]
MLTSLLVLALLLGLAAWSFVRLQGGIDPASIAPATVTIDELGVPTIRASSWPLLAEAQGYVVASERLFQMDLMRRAAGGRLSEWFGPATLDLDRMRRAESWPELARRGYEELPAEEREVVDRYAAGVNRFIADHRHRWGLEYAILRVEPEAWRGEDTLLVLLSMLDQLTRSAEQEAWVTRWSRALGPEWSELLFTSDHPWNEPMFGEKRPGPKLPHADALPMQPIQAEEEHAELLRTVDESAVGSNNWVHCKGARCLLANDPHLGLSVPSLWFGIRLELASEEWVVGVTIPGLPFVTLGMSSYLAWAFTNVGEDVDDWLREKLTPDQQQYLAAVGPDGTETWKDVERVRHTIRVRGAPDSIFEVPHTHRGPLLLPGDRSRASGGPFAGLGLEGAYSRQWLGARPGMLRLPVRVNRARSIEEMNEALDEMKAPAQNVLIAERSGRIGYRASGSTVIRRTSGRGVADAIVGEWVGIAEPESRRRIVIETSTGTRFLATANERIWVDEFGHRFGDDARKDRIRTVLASLDDASVADMEALQRDTTSRFHRALLDWVLRNAEVPKARAEAWGRFERAADDPKVFTEALAVESKLLGLLVERARRGRLPAEAKNWPFPGRLPRAVMLQLMAEPDGFHVFGLEDSDVARYLARTPEASTTYVESNRWQAQHPLARRVPLLGGLFLVPEVAQVGYDHLVRTERPSFGASVRLVWSPSNPSESRWSLPVGQSGHVGSRHFADLARDWFAGATSPPVARE